MSLFSAPVVTPQLDMFDMYGVLVSSVADIALSLSHGLADMGLPALRVSIRAG